MSANDPAPVVTRPEDVLPDDQDRAVIGGVDIRKGTIAAFLRNARRWRDPATPEAERERLAQEMRDAVPALRALDLLDIFSPRDPALAALIDSVRD